MLAWRLQLPINPATRQNVLQRIHSRFRYLRILQLDESKTRQAVKRGRASSVMRQPLRARLFSLFMFLKC